MTGGRGRTRIGDAVVAKIAAVAAGEVTAVAGGQRRVAGRPAGRLDRPQVRVAVVNSLVTADIAATVSYPAALREVTRAVRDQVTARVRELTGMHVGAVHVAVTGLVPAPAAAIPADAEFPADTAILAETPERG